LGRFSCELLGLLILSLFLLLLQFAILLVGFLLILAKQLLLLAQVAALVRSLLIKGGDQGCYLTTQFLRLLPILGLICGLMALPTILTVAHLLLVAIDLIERVVFI